MNKQELNEALVKFGLVIDEKTSDQLEQYLIYILAENMRTNLTAIKDPEEIRSKHFLDSLSLYKYAPNEFVYPTSAVCAPLLIN